MKEVLAVIRPNKFGIIKNALSDAGFPAFSCRKVMGRGKKYVDSSIFEAAVIQEELSTVPAAEYLESTSRLMPKRLLTMVVQDADVKTIVDVIIEHTSEGNPGDGKIFILPISESIRIRDGEFQNDSESY